MVGSWPSCMDETRLKQRKCQMTRTVSASYRDHVFVDSPLHRTLQRIQRRTARLPISSKFIRHKSPSISRKPLFLFASNMSASHLPILPREFDPVFVCSCAWALSRRGMCTMFMWPFAASKKGVEPDKQTIGARCRGICRSNAGEV